VFRKGYVAFQRPGGYNTLIIDMSWRRPLRLAVKLPDTPAALALANLGRRGPRMGLDPHSRQAHPRPLPGRRNRPANLPRHRPDQAPVTLTVNKPPGLDRTAVTRSGNLKFFSPERTVVLLPPASHRPVADGRVVMPSFDRLGSARRCQALLHGETVGVLSSNLFPNATRCQRNGLPSTHAGLGSPQPRLGVGRGRPRL
jgi:hypothetical protein